MAVTFSVQSLHLTSVDIYSLNIPAGIAVWQALCRMAVRADSEPAVVTNIDFTIRPNGGAVGPASGFGYDLFGSVRAHARERAARDLHYEDATVVHRDGAFGELESCSD